MKSSKFIRRGAIVAAFAFGSAAFADDTATQTVTFAVTAINEISVNGDPGTLTVSTATAGSEPDTVNDSSTTYAITTNETDRKITVQIDEAIPTGVTLTANLAAPTGAQSAGAVALTQTPVDAVTGISTLNEADKSIIYSLTATAAAGTVAEDTVTVTLTITADA